MKPKRIPVLQILLLLPALALLGATPAQADVFSSPLDEQHAGQYIEVVKSARKLRVVEAGRTVASFSIASGRGGRGDKQRRGDNRTPTGTYHIIDVNDASRFHLFMQLDYPNVKDAFLALRRGLIDRPVFDHIVSARQSGKLPPQNTILGGQIGIHGLGDDENDEKLDLHRKLDWTQGCVALTNAQVRMLRSRVDVGIRVTIRD